MRPRLAGIGHPSALLALTAAACGSGGGGRAARRRRPVTITMWTRAATQAQSERLVKAYNATHKNQVKLTVIPTDDYQPRSPPRPAPSSCPTCSPPTWSSPRSYTSQGLWLDITDRFNALPFKDKVAPAHVRSGTLERQALRGAAHARHVGAALQQGPVHQGRARPGEAAEDAEGVRRARRHDPTTSSAGDSPRHVLRRQLRRLLRLHLLAVGLGRRRRRHERRGHRRARSTTEAMAEVFALYRKLYDEGVAGAGVQGRGRARPGSAPCRAARSASCRCRRRTLGLIEDKPT